MGKMFSDVQVASRRSGVVRSAARRRARAVAIKGARGGGGLRVGMRVRSQVREGRGRDRSRRAVWSWVARSGGIL